MPQVTISIENFNEVKHLSETIHGLLKVRDKTGVYPPLVDTEYDFDSFAQWLMEDEPFVRSIALVDEVPAGHISLVKAHDYLTSFLSEANIESSFVNGFSEIGKFFVNPDHQHHGIGKILFTHAIKKSLDLNFHPALSVVSTSHDAIRFYTHNGWRNVGSFDGHHG